MDTGSLQSTLRKHIMRLLLIVAGFSALLFAFTGKAQNYKPTFADPYNPSSCYEVDPEIGVIPVPTKRANPDYPMKALRKRITGWVLMEGSIGPDGHVTSAQVIESDPPGVFDSSALQAFRHWVYCPPSPEIPYPESFEVTLRFQLR